MEPVLRSPTVGEKDLISSLFRYYKYYDHFFFQCVREVINIWLSFEAATSIIISLLDRSENVISLSQLIQSKKLWMMTID